MCVLCARMLTVDNWWDDTERHKAIEVRMFSIRHGVRFGIAFHTVSSFDAKIAHQKHLARIVIVDCS